jgi:excisionase family DNA binding protein
MSRAQAARRLGVSESSVRQYIEAGKLRVTQTVLGRLIDPASVEALIAQREARGTAAP